MKLIPLTQNQHAIVDDEDADRVNRHSWHPNGRGYAITTLYNPKRTILLHRFIMNAGPGEEVDHRDRDKMNCRKINLRKATRVGNVRNTGKRRDGISSRFKGVHKHQGGKWEAGIRVNRHRIYLGLYSLEEDAACAYDKAARHYFGEFAYTNF